MIAPDGKSAIIGRIEQVLVDGSPGPETEGSADVGAVSWDLTIFVEGTAVLVSDVKTFYPLPNDGDYTIDASQAVYAGRLVPVIENGDELQPMIPVYPATQECDATAPISTALNAARRSGSTLSLDARIAQTVQRVLQSMNQ